MNDQPHPISIVVADDHPVVLHGVADVLRFNSDINVVAVCSDGATALEAIRKWSPNVAVLDIAMPGGTGRQALTSLKASSKLRHIPVLVLSGSVEPADEPAILALGAAEFIRKPVEAESLDARLRALLGDEGEK